MKIVEYIHKLTTAERWGLLGAGPEAKLFTAEEGEAMIQVIGDLEGFEVHFLYSTDECTWVWNVPNRARTTLEQIQRAATVMDLQRFTTWLSGHGFKPLFCTEGT